jgi:hypothetical protein
MLDEWENRLVDYDDDDDSMRPGDLVSVFRFYLSTHETF